MPPPVCLWRYLFDGGRLQARPASRVRAHAATDRAPYPGAGCDIGLRAKPSKLDTPGQRHRAPYSERAHRSWPVAPAASGRLCYEVPFLRVTATSATPTAIRLAAGINPAGGASFCT